MSWPFAFLEHKKARARYESQRNNAKLRGIRWDFTFKTWLAWWGDDLDKRGPGREQLSMQRRWDEGPYAAWNVTKGTPKDNARTRVAMQQRKRPVAWAVPQKEGADYLELDDGMPDLGYASMRSVYGIG